MRNLRASRFVNRRSGSVDKTAQSMQNLRKAELRQVFSKTAQNLKLIDGKVHKKESQPSDDKENAKKQKLVIPKDIISFQARNNAAPEKPKAVIVRKVYVRKSREMVKNIAERGK